MLDGTTILWFLGAYFLLLLGVSYITSKRAEASDFFIGNRKSHWFLVSFGMIGTSLSGVTFVSVPGLVGKSGFEYITLVLGYLLGYVVVALVLLPLYYRLQLTSIYTYLRTRFGPSSYKTGAIFFMISRTMGSALRLYLVINVLQIFLLERMGFSFFLTSVIILLMIILYTSKGGVKTIVWTDSLQTFFMISALVIFTVYILNILKLDVTEAFQIMDARGYTDVLKTSIFPADNFFKQLIGGMFITIAMAGLDQEMMQKNISVDSIRNSQKNVLVFCFILLAMNMIFLFLGGLLNLFSEAENLKAVGDDLFPTVALQHVPTFLSWTFIIGLVSALFPSADGAITALTSSFSIDLLEIQNRKDWSERKKTQTRLLIHLSFALLFLLSVMIFKWIDDKSAILMIFTLASYTYGPLLGLFAFGILTRYSVKDSLVIRVCLLAPVLSWLLSQTPRCLGLPYEFGFELLPINGLITFIGLYIIKRK